MPSVAPKGLGGTSSAEFRISDHCCSEKRVGRNVKDARDWGIIDATNSARMAGGFPSVVGGGTRRGKYST